MTTEHQDLDSIDHRADRVLDGMTINRDLFARDAKRMAAELRQWRAAHARTEARTKGEPGFAGSFVDILKGFRK